MRRLIPYVLTACVMLSVLLAPLASLGEPEPVTSDVDFHFVSPSLETVPAGNLKAGETVRLIAHIGLDAYQTWRKAGVVVDRGAPGDPDSITLGSPTVLFDGGEYKMWYTGTDQPSPYAHILYANSSNGLTWTKQGVVLTPGIPGDDRQVNFAWVMKDGSQYKMWYSGYDGVVFRIFLATSPNGIAWTKQGLVLDIGSPGSYDDTFVYRPCVILDGTYKMWYAGFDGVLPRLMYATSPDGVAWTKQGLALDVGPPGSLDDNAAYMASVLKEGTDYHMWYTGDDGSKGRILYATSQDSVVWTKKGLVLDVGAPGSTEDARVYSPAVLHLLGQEYEMWYAGRTGTTDRIHYANLTPRSLPMNIDVSFYLDSIGPGSMVGTASSQVGALSPIVVEVNWIAAPLGRHTVFAVADPANQVPETSETNNNVSITVIVTNAPPIADAGLDQGVFRNQLTILNGTASTDPDGQPLHYRWTETSGTPVALSGTDTPTPTFIPPLSGIYTFKLTVFDDWGGISNDFTNVTVTNRPPIADAGQHGSVAKRTLVTLNGTASSDPDGDSLLYIWIQTAGPPVTLLNPDTATPAFLASNSGIHEFTLSVDDGDSGVDSDFVQIEVVNAGPVADAGIDRTVQKRTLVILVGTGSSDLDGDVLTYSWVQTGGPAAVLLDPNTVAPSFVPVVSGIYVLMLTVNDGDGGSDTDSVQIVVTNTNPIADAGPDFTVRKYALVTLVGNGSYDPDNDLLDYSWSQISGPPVVLSGVSTPAPTFTPTVRGTYVFSLTVDDGDSGTDIDVMRITVTNSHPFADAGPDISVHKNSLVTLDGSNSDDSDGDALDYAWTQTSGPAMSLSGADTATPSFTPQTAGIYVLELRVADNDGEASIDVVAVEVWSLAPVASLTASSLSVYVGNEIRFNASFSSDLNGAIVDYSFDFGDGQTVSGSAKERSHAYGEPGKYSVLLTVTDEDGNKSSVKLGITVVPLPQPPRDILAEMWWLLIILVALVVVVVILLVEMRKLKKRISALEAESDEAKIEEPVKGEVQ